MLAGYLCWWRGSTLILFALYKPVSLTWLMLFPRRDALGLTPYLPGPRVHPDASIPVGAGPFANTSKSLSPADGSCGKCGIEAPGGIRLVYWEPDSAVTKGSNITLGQNPGQAYTQVDNGFTYTSPSVYVIYSSLRATATCSDSALHTIGPSFDEKTIAYSSRFLAYGTLSIADAGCSEFVVVDGFHTIDFSSLYYNPITTTTTYKAGCSPYVNPRLSLPAPLTNVDPSWQSCEPLFYGAFDPPSVLTKQSGGLVPSPVGAAAVTNPAEAQGNSDGSPPAQPVVTPAPPFAAPTPNAAINNSPPAGKPPPKSPAPGEVNPVQAAGGRPEDAIAPGPAPPPPAADTDKVPSGDVAGQQQAGNVPAPGPGLPAPVATGNEDSQRGGTGAGKPAAPPAGPPPSLGNLIYNPFSSNNGKPVSGPAPIGNPAAVAANPDKSPGTPPLVAVPVNTGDGKPAYAVVAAEPAVAGGNNGQVAAVPLTGTSGSNQQLPAPNNEGASSGGSSGGGSSGGGGGDTTKVTLNDGTTADIPTADIVEPGQLQGNGGGAAGHAAVSGSNPDIQEVPTNPEGFVAIAGSSSRSIAVQAGGYLIPTPVADDVPQQTLTLQGGQITTVPIETPRQITLEGGKVTQIAGNAMPQVLTLQNGQVSTISPVSHTTVKLANGQVTVVPVAASDVGQTEYIDIPDATISGSVHYTRLPIIELQPTLSSGNYNQSAALSSNESTLSMSIPISTLPSAVNTLPLISSSGSMAAPATQSALSATAGNVANSTPTGSSASSTSGGKTSSGTRIRILLDWNSDWRLVVTMTLMLLQLLAGVVMT